MDVKKILNLKESEIQRILDKKDLDATDKFVLKELMRANDSDIEFKTVVNSNQINAISKLLFIEKCVNAQSLQGENATLGQDEIDDSLQSLIHSVLRLSVSHNRKGREEFIQAWTGREKEKKVKSGLFFKKLNDQPIQNQENEGGGY